MRPQTCRPARKPVQVGNNHLLKRKPPLCQTNLAAAKSELLRSNCKTCWQKYGDRTGFHNAVVASAADKAWMKQLTTEQHRYFLQKLWDIYANPISLKTKVFPVFTLLSSWLLYIIQFDKTDWSLIKLTYIKEGEDLSLEGMKA